jgi:hypothetical protein
VEKPRNPIHSKSNAKKKNQLKKSKINLKNPVSIGHFCTTKCNTGHYTIATDVWNYPIPS